MTPALKRAFRAIKVWHDTSFALIDELNKFDGLERDMVFTELFQGILRTTAECGDYLSKEQILACHNELELEVLGLKYLSEDKIQ